MTIQSYTWAMDQNVPGEAGSVLRAIANRAEHRTGRVSWDVEEIVHEARITENALPRYLGALRRNGYLDFRERDGQRQYWLMIGRDVSRGWDWNAQEIAEETNDAPSVRPAPDIAPARFSAAAQAKELEKAKPKPRTEYPVIEGSRADREWQAYLKALKPPQKPPFLRSMLVDGVTRRGYPMPTLFPPKEQEQIAV